MTTYEVGDHVLIRGKVVLVYGGERGYEVELFSKTDRYDAIVRPDLIVGKTAAPPMDEPDRESLVVDDDGDVWRFRDGFWKLTRNAHGVTWAQLIEAHGPVRVYEATS